MFCNLNYTLSPRHTPRFPPRFLVTRAALQPPQQYRAERYNGAELGRHRRCGCGSGSLRLTWRTGAGEMASVRAHGKRALGGLVQSLRRDDTAVRLAIASILWGTLLGPALHLIDHRADHDHGPSHAHGPFERPHRHAEPSPPRHTGPGAQASDGLPLAEGHGGQGQGAPRAPHGDGQALHFGLALLGGVQVIPLAAPVAIAEPIPPEHTSIARPRPAAKAHRPRGPPQRPV
jgi:hypothetical protein